MDGRARCAARGRRLRGDDAEAARRRDRPRRENRRTTEGGIMSAALEPVNLTTLTIAFNRAIPAFPRLMLRSLSTAASRGDAKGCRIWRERADTWSEAVLRVRMLLGRRTADHSELLAELQRALRL